MIVAVRRGDPAGARQEDGRIATLGPPGIGSKGRPNLRAEVRGLAG